MKLFKLELHTGKNRIVRDVVVHAATEEEGKDHVRKEFKDIYPKMEVRHCHELVITPAHFVVGSWTTD